MHFSCKLLSNHYIRLLTLPCFKKVSYCLFENKINTVAFVFLSCLLVLNVFLKAQKSKTNILIILNLTDHLRAPTYFIVGN